MNINILGISELKWTGMGGFNSDYHYIYYVGKNPLEEKEHPSHSAEVCNAVHRCNLKNNRMTSVCFQVKPFNMTVI